MSSIVKTSKAIKKEDIEIVFTKYVWPSADNSIYKNEKMFFHYILFIFFYYLAFFSIFLAFSIF